MTIYEHLPRLKHTNNLLLGLTCGGIDLVCHIKENEVVQGAVVSVMVLVMQGVWVVVIVIGGGRGCDGGYGGLYVWVVVVGVGQK